jgi:hypothetical protein
MTYQISQPPVESEQRRPYLWLERLFVIAFVLSILVGVLALVALLTLRNDQPPPVLAPPLSTLQTDLVQAPLALHQLAGDPAAGLAAQAIQAGYLETARSILLYETELIPALRANQLVQLGKSYLAAGDPATAAQTLRLVLPVAILGANLPTLERAQLLTQAAEGLSKAAAPDAALEAARQAALIAAQSPDLLPAQRSQIFNQLVRLAADLGDDAFRQQMDDYARNPFLASSGMLVTSSLATFAQLPPYDDPTLAAIDARRSAATLLTDRIALTNGVDIDPERQGFEQALLAEDLARTAFYASALTPGNSAIGLQQQAGLLLDQLAWQATKLRIADGGFGLSIAPAWEQGRSEIAATFDATLTNLRTVSDQYAMSLPAPVEQAIQRVANQYLLAGYAERGLSQMPAESLAEQVRIAQDDLARQGAAVALPIIYNAAAVPPGFRVRPEAVAQP